MVTQAISNLEDATITLSPTNAKGQPATIDPSASAWRVEDPQSTGATATAGADALTCEVVTGRVGEFDVFADIDVDLGGGVETITEQFHFIVSSAKATNLNPSIGVHPKP